MFAGERLTGEKAEQLCRLYFRCGFLFLPWLWFANAAMFYRYREKSAVIAWYVRYSLLLFALSLIPFVAWYATIYHHWGDAPFWIIRPHVAGQQRGWFAGAVYENV